MTEAALSHSFTIFKGDGATPEVFSRIVEVGDIKAPAGSTDEIAVTSHDSDAKEFLLGLSDFGECTFPVHFVAGDTGHQALYDESVSKAKGNYLITDDADDPTLTLAFTGYVKPLAFAFPVDGVVNADVTFRVTGACVLTMPEGS